MAKNSQTVINSILQYLSLTITHLFATWYIAVIFIPQQEPEQGGVGREPPCRPRVGPAAVFVLTGFRHILL